MKWKKVFIWLTVVVITIFGAGWLFGWFSNNAAIAEVRQLQEKAADPKLTDADRRALFDQMRAKMDALPESARREVREAGRQVFEARAEAHMTEILAMSKAQQVKAIDADIDAMEKRRAEFEKRMQANGGQPNANANGQKGNGTKGRPAATNDSQRVDRLKNRLDRSTPESRAKRNAYMTLVNQRRQQRGLPVLTGGGPGGGFGGRGGR
jgi:hypothetical protein